MADDIATDLLLGLVGGGLAYLVAHNIDNRRIRDAARDAICSDIDDIRNTAADYWRTDAGSPEQAVAQGVEMLITSKFTPLGRDIEAFRLKHKRTLDYKHKLIAFRIAVTNDPFGSAKRTTDPQRITAIADTASILKHAIRGTAI